MSRWRRIGLSLTFAMTLAGGVLISQPAQAYTLTQGQCAQLATFIQKLDALAAQYPHSRFIAYLLEEFKEAYQNHC